jgi:hypothetical protein
MKAACRLAPIFAANLAGYSRVTGADEQGMLQRLQDDPIEADRSEKIAGRIVKATLAA